MVEIFFDNKSVFSCDYYDSFIILNIVFSLPKKCPNKIFATYLCMCKNVSKKLMTQSPDDLSSNVFFN